MPDSPVTVPPTDAMPRSRAQGGGPKARTSVRARTSWVLGALAAEILFASCNAITGLDASFTVESCPRGCPDASSPLDAASDTAAADADGDAPVDAAADAPDACGDCAAQILNANGAACTALGCDYTTCLAGYGDEDGNPANGCESTLPTGVPEIGNLVLWLRGDDWDGFTWPDQSPGGRDAKLYYGSVGFGTLNGHHTVAFDGNGELRIVAGFPDWQGVTIMTVMTAPDGNGAPIAMGVSFNPGCATAPPSGAAGCDPYDMLRFDISLELSQCDPNIGTCYQAYPESLAGVGWQRSIGVLTPGATPSYHAYLSGIDEGALPHNRNYPYPAPWSTPRTDTILGWGGLATNMFSGSIAELILFDTALSDASRVALDAYLQAKWGI